MDTSTNKQKIFLILGNNIDRKVFNAIQDRINRDYDIKKLIRTLKPSIVNQFLIIISTIVLFISETNFDISSITSSNIAKSILNIFNTPLIAFLSIIILMKSLISFINDFKDIFSASMTTGKYLKYQASKYAPKVPTDLWKFLHGSVVDVQILNIAQQLLNNKEIGVIYSGLPYYETKYIDYITIKWIPSKKCKIKYRLKFFVQLWQKLFFHSFLKRYSHQVFFAKAEKQYFKNNNKKLERSNSVFGILFFSNYLKEELRRQNLDQIENITCEFDGKNRFSYYSNYIEKKPLSAELSDIEIAYEWIKYCTIPSILYNSSQNSNTKKNDNMYTLQICNISINSDSKEWTRWDAFKNFFSTEIHIPVKRFIAIPKNSNKANCNFPSNTTSKDKTIYISVGGAEQNLALQSIINNYRWSNTNKLRIGFAENSFENTSDLDFLVGTEGLVYGIKSKVMGRLNLKNSTSCIAEVFQMNFPENITVYSVYGFGALATKIAFCQFCFALSQIDNITPHYTENTAEQFIPTLSFQFKELLEYEITNEDKKLYNTETGKYWDENDLINNIHNLLEWLNNSNKNHITIH